MLINSNNYSVLEIIQMLDRRELVVNKSYQRSSGIWPDGPSSYFIDTILESYPFPKIYMYEYINRDEKSVKKELVDGQQRITTIKRFYDNELRISGESKFSGKKFFDLNDEEQEIFLTYPVSVDVIRGATRSQILQMFRRMNAYTLPLNAAEKRHSSFHGPFKWFINEMSDYLNEFFVDFKVFSDREIIRMSDAQFIADCIIALERGIVSSSSSDLNKIYQKYDSDFPEIEYYSTIIKDVFHFIASDLGCIRGTYMTKSYALHSLFTALAFNKFGIESIQNQFNVPPLQRYTNDLNFSSERIVSLALAHEAKEEDGPHGNYVWGCISSTTKAPRRTARVKSLLSALGVEFPEI